MLGRAPEVPDDWTLNIQGGVTQPLSLSLEQLRQYPRQDVEATLECNYSIGPALPADVIPLERDGWINLRDLMLIADEWLRCFVLAASNPSPAAGEQNVPLVPLLEWSPNEEAVYSDVYLGTDLRLVAIATHESEEYLGTVEENHIELEQPLKSNTTYYWRVNRIGPRCTAPGDIWNFKTTGNQPYRRERKDRRED